MKIVDRKTFLAMPAGTLFANYKPCVFENLMIKGETWYGVDGENDKHRIYGDFLNQWIVEAIKADSSEEWGDKLDDSMKNGTSLAMDFDCQIRDGGFDPDQLFAVWEEADVRQLIERLIESIEETRQKEREVNNEGICMGEG